MRKYALFCGRLSKNEPRMWVKEELHKKYDGGFKDPVQRAQRDVA